MSEEEQIEAIERSFPMIAISRIYGEYIMNKEETE